MWNCPKCGRTFRNTNQSHYCGKAPQTIAEYILDQPEDIRPLLRTLCEAIHAAIPEAKEKISWSMPTFWNGCNLIQFAAFPKHIGLYPGPEAVEAFADRLSRSGLPNPDFVAFSREITLLRYARQGADRETVALGTRAYLRFRSLMKRSERLKFDLHRALKGLGDFNQIP